MNCVRTNPVRFTIVGGLLCTMIVIGGCSRQAKAPDVTQNVRHALDQAKLNDVSVKDDRDKGVVTLGGHVASDDLKSQAETIARVNAGTQVVANEIAVVPPSDSGNAKTANADIDKAIDKNLDAALVQNHLKKHVSYSVKNGVVTLKGYVNAQNTRNQIQTIASQVPNVTQVVNELDVKYSRATSSR